MGKRRISLSMILLQLCMLIAILCSMNVHQNRKCDSQFTEPSVSQTANLKFDISVCAENKNVVRMNICNTEEQQKVQ